MALSDLSRLSLNSSRDGNSTTSLGCPFQCLITLSENEFNLNLPWHSLQPCPLILSQFTREEADPHLEAAVCLFIFKDLSFYRCVWVFFCSCWKGAGGWAGVTQGMLLCDTGVAVTQGKLVRVATIKLLTPAKLLFAKASYQLRLKLKGV